jgi:hypothetical protein
MAENLSNQFAGAEVEVRSTRQADRRIVTTLQVGRGAQRARGVYDHSIESQNTAA